MKYSYALSSAAAHDRAVAELAAGAPPSAPAYVVIRPAAPYDLATPGTPQGLRQLAAAALEGGRFTASAALAVAISSADGSVVASLGLRMRGDEPGRPRRAWAVYVRREAEDGAVCWESAGAALLDAGVTPRVRPIGILELRCVLRGEVYVPPPPRAGPPRLACFGCDRIVPFSVTTWRPYARHVCSTSKEGAS